MLLRSRAVLVLAACVSLCLAVPAWAGACPVCFSPQTESSAVEGAKAAAFFLVAVTYGLLLAAAGTFLFVRRRAARGRG